MHVPGGAALTAGGRFQYRGCAVRGGSAQPPAGSSGPPAASFREPRRGDSAVGGGGRGRSGVLEWSCCLVAPGRERGGLCTDG